MKKFRSIAACTMVLVILLLCAGCVDMQAFENATARQFSETMLDALIANDPQTAYALVSKLCSEKEFTVIFQQMRDAIGDADTYELELLSINTNTSVNNGETSKRVRSIYQMTTDSGRQVVEITMEEQLGVVSFYMVPYERTDYYYTGTLSSMKGANVGQWLLLLLNVVSLGVTVFAIADCCRKPIKKKFLWILVMVLGVVTLGMTAADSGFQLNLNLIQIPAYSALIRYGSGKVVLRLALPVGTIVYFSIRRSLLTKPVRSPGIPPVDTAAPMPDAPEVPEAPQEPRQDDGV